MKQTFIRLNSRFSQRKVNHRDFLEIFFGTLPEYPCSKTICSLRIWVLAMKKSPQRNPRSATKPPAPELTRAARIKALKQAVASGTYQISDRALAQSLLRDLLGEEWEWVRFFKIR